MKTYEQWMVEYKSQKDAEYSSGVPRILRWRDGSLTKAIQQDARESALREAAEIAQKKEDKGFERRGMKESILSLIEKGKK